ncbi:hypothetical protein Tco_0252296 [Tanacetum coccineum]
MKEQAYNKDKDQDQDSRTQRQRNLHKPKEARFKDLASGEIVSLKLLSIHFIGTWCVTADGSCPLRSRFAADRGAWPGVSLTRIRIKAGPGPFRLLGPSPLFVVFVLVVCEAFCWNLLESQANLCVLDRMSMPTQCCDMGSDGYAYPVYDMFGIVDPNMQNEQLIESLFWDIVVCRKPMILAQLYVDVLSIIFSSLIPLSHGSFNVLVGMDRLSKRKFGIVCYETVVRIPLEGDEILRIHGELEFRVDLVPGATPVVKSLYRLAPLEMQELSEQLRELQDKGFIQTTHFPWGTCTVLSFVRRGAWSSFEVRGGRPRVGKRRPAEMLHDLGQQMEKRADDGNVVTDALSRKLGTSELEVRAMTMIIQYGVRGMILAAQNAAESVRDTIGFEYWVASSSGWTKSPVLWAEIGESSLIGPELVQETTDKVVLIKEKSSSDEDHSKEMC